MVLPYGGRVGWHRIVKASYESDSLFFSDIQGRVFSDQSLPSPVNYSVSMVNSW